MRLLDLSVTHFLGIDRAQVSFDPGLVAIVGPNGAGKSSLLDALVVALFGEPSPVRPLRQSHLVRLGADWGEISLSFSVDEGLFRVTRRFRPNRAQEARLERYREGRWEMTASTVQALAAELTRLLAPRPFGEPDLGRLRDSFLASVFVSQGQVTRLVDAAPAERWALLSAVLGLDDEDRLRARARIVLDLSQAEEERLGGERKALDDRLSLLPGEADLASGLEEAGKEIARREKTLEAFRRAFDARRELDRLDGALLAAELEARSARSRLEEALRLDRLGEAAEGLALLKERARSLAAIRRRAEALRGQGAEAAIRLEEKKALLQALRREWKEKESLLSDVEALARKAEKGRLLAEARREISRIEDSLEKGEIERLHLRSRRTELEAMKAALLRRRLKERLDGTVEAHRQEAARLASLIGELSQVLLAWLLSLADGDGLVRPQRFRGAQVLAFAQSLRRAGLQERLDRQGRSRQDCLRLLHEGARLREELKKLPPSEGLPPPEGSVEPVEEERIRLERQEERLAGAMDERRRRREALAGTSRSLEEGLGFPDERTLEGFFEARRRREELLAEKEALRKRGESLRDETELLSVEATRLDVQAERAEEALDEERRLLLQTVEAWRRTCARRQWSADELREALALGRRDLSPGLLEAARAREETARRAFESVRGSRDRFRASFPSEPPSAEALASLMAEAEGHLRRAWTTRTRLEETQAECRRLLERRSLLERLAGDLLPAFDGARRLFHLTEGRSFPRFVSDHLMEGLLGAVNEALPEGTWRLRARKGVIEVVEGEGVRPASSLSGGERAFISLLMLRRLAAQVGFQRLLFIDEGLSMLDDGHLERIIDLLGTLGREAFVAVITHDPDVAAAFPRQWRLDGGRLVEEEGPA